VFGSLPKVPRPIILILVYGVFLVLVGITATAQSLLVGNQFSTSTLNAIAGSDAATTRAFVNAYVLPRYLDPAAGPTAEELARLRAQLATLTRPSEIVRVELRRPDGGVVASSDASAAELTGASAASFQQAVSGSSQASIGDARGEEVGAASGVSSVLQEFLPLSTNGHVRAVMAIWRDAAPILQRLETVRRDVVLLTLSAGLIAAAVLYLIFRSAQRRLTRQTQQLVESTRRDPLTGLLNHGALIGVLAERIEAAKAAGESLEIALVDLDNFRLLNEHHGHPAGDAALRAVAAIVDGAIGAPFAVGRSGPDEFLLVGVVGPERVLEATCTAMQARLAEVSLQFEGTERLPVTVSAAIARFPEHGASMTVLLATAARTLEEAKASGGDAVLVASRSVSDDPAPAGFDVLQGLVHAVDTKDRYTKRHSADVARYAAFIADRVGLDAEFVETIRVAGLLHDVGKIAIPNAILRKPGRLTDDEQAVLQQHVALGESIIRDVANVDLVRAGIRHHHERWDGTGYLDRLAGTDIPTIARILAVADAFSAMTTTRPYRKALDVREALTRLGDAAGTQLDADLVTAFITGIETADDPPLPERSAAAGLVRLHVA
jgi:diguanylate cyclase (GGDEF)-like protein/putative nucleotidyltransferase with HDIG domain